MPDRPSPRCRLHPAVAVGPSRIQGRGLFAAARIAEGTVVSRLGGRLVSGAGLREAFEAAARLPAPAYVDTISVGEDLHLILPPGSPNGFGNHGCDPNLWWVDAYRLAARRDIEPGEELTNDYGTSTAVAGFRMDCRCAAAVCRGVVTGADWRRADLRARYGDHWIPLLLAWIRTQEAS